MQIQFEKYQGTGNDFVMVNNLDGSHNDLSLSEVKFICDRRFGVGADGLIRINHREGFDFEMDYFNSDGSKSFCGNGARCSVAFAESLGIDVSETTFYAIDGAHRAWKENEIVSLEMKNVDQVKEMNGDLVLHTGSPHYIHFENDKDKKEVVAFGRSIRYSESFKEEGINVNLVTCNLDNQLQVETYERGVEDETFSCGTGVTASAIAAAFRNDLFGSVMFDVKVKGGQLKVTFDRTEKQLFENIRLSGPAQFVFKGSINV